MQCSFAKQNTGHGTNAAKKVAAAPADTYRRNGKPLLQIIVLKTQLLAFRRPFLRKIASRCSTGSVAKTCRTKRPPKAAMSQRPRPKTLFAGRLAKKPRFPANPDALALPGSCFSAFCLFLPGRKPVCGTVPSMCPLFFRFLFCNPVSNHL